MPLTTSLHLPVPEDPSPEDIFSSSLIQLFTDDTQNQHGHPGSEIIYRSPRYGDITLQLVDPKAEDTKLFAQYLWNAGVQLAELIEAGGERWQVSGENVLEVGAGSGLVGIISALAGAQEVVISDYPATEILTNISINIQKNIPPQLLPRVSVQGHEWGRLTDPLSMTHAGRFTVILAADVFWMPGQHRSLARSMLHFLSTSSRARVFVVAGFHTGRANVARFFEVAEEEGLFVEMRVERDVEGKERVWEADRGFEDVVERKRWLVTAALVSKAAYVG